MTEERESKEGESFARRMILAELDILIAELDPKVPQPNRRRRLYEAVVRIYQRTDLDSYTGSVRELLAESLSAGQHL